MPLSNVFSSRLDDLVNSSDKKDVIRCRQIKNAISPELLRTRKNKIASYSKIKEETSGRNRVAGHSEMKKGATEKNRVASHLALEEEIKGANRNMFKVSFFY